MRRLARTVLLAVAAAVASFSGVLVHGTLAADEGPTADEMRRRVEWVRSLPPEEKAKLKDALAKFRAMPDAEREKLRGKASKLGADRLEGLAGRDLASLRRSRSTMVAETDAIFETIGPARLAELTDDDRAYLRSEALRGFQRHVQRRLLGLVTYDDLEKMPAAEKRARLQAGIARTIDDRLARLPDEERARLQSLPATEKAEARSRLFAEFRMDETREFAKVFDRFRVHPFLQLPPEKRAERVRKWKEQARWFAAVKTLRDEVGIGEDARRALASLGPADWARVSFEVIQSEQDEPAERRLRLETLVLRLAGERAVDPGRRPPPLPRYLRDIRERRILNGPRR